MIRLVIGAKQQSPFALPNIRRFVAFRILFNARFYYPVFTIVFLDFGLSLEQFAMLNVAWAASIVLLEVPSGALADTVGRRNLVVAASAIMVIEMCLLSFAPIGAHPVVFYLFLANRILSGAAEAAASGADEALAYDTLQRDGDASKWGHVLETLMKWQSVAFMFAMSIGAATYDHELLNRVFEYIGADFSIGKNVAIKLPLYGTLILSVFCFITALGLKEVAHKDDEEKATSKSFRQSLAILREAFGKTMEAGKWILHTPLAFMIILSGLLFDHVGRMVLTLNSQYYRQIELPEASFGIISSALSLIGFFVPKYAKRLAENRSKSFNFALVAVLIAVGLTLMTRFFPLWGAVPITFIYVSFFFIGYFVSHYLNEITSSDIRATVLSFKGLSFNLAYGGIGILYSLLVHSLRKPDSSSGIAPEVGEAHLFEKALQWFPGYFLLTALAVYAIGWKLLGNQDSTVSARSK